ncbi:hypothetical protein Clacol_003365 [Clathrus columnatus]|uniref:Uncharacterized protein n=1 Tax=Clathrus columnatus TaxID=1419009 RepID=A0AAV5A7F0_9AGAM|nr:hypothetical protein Clacol_003365 [Clathrus columnatus]
MAAMTITEQVFCRGCLDPEARTPTGYVGWRWLQCTDIPDEYRVLIPPTIVRCYTQLKEAEDSELRIQYRPIDWKHIAALRHVKDRLIKRCRQLGKFRPGYEPFGKHSVIAPPDFTLRQLERWSRDQNAFGFAKPSKHRSSSQAQTASPVSVNTTTTATTTRNTPSTPLRAAKNRHANGATTPTQSLSSTPLRPTTDVTTTPTPSSTHHSSPATSLSSGCFYVVFRCPRHCPIECCEKETTQSFAPPNPSHPVTDVLPPRVVPMQSQRYGCQCYNSPYEEEQQPIINTPTDIPQTSLESRIVVESVDREPALNVSPPAPIALQLLTPEASASTNQKPLPPTPPSDNLNFQQTAFGTEKTQTPMLVDNEPQRQRQASLPPSYTLFKTSRKQPSAADKEFQEQNPSLFSLSSSNKQSLAVQQLDPNLPSTSNAQPPAIMEKKGKGKEELFVMKNGQTSPIVVETQTRQHPLSLLPAGGKLMTSNRKGKGKENAVIPSETQSLPANRPSTGHIRVDGEDFLLITPIPPRQSTVKRPVTYPEMTQKKKSVRFTSRTPSPMHQFSSRIIRPGNWTEKDMPMLLAPEWKPLIPQIMITLPSPTQSSEESGDDEMYNEQLLVPLATRTS